MMRRSLAALLLLMQGAVFAEPSALQPGLYEVRLQTVFDDAKSVVPANTVRRCVSATEIAAPHLLAPQFSGGAECMLSDFHKDEQSASWVWQCKQDPPMHGEAHVRWNTSDYAGETRMTLERGAERMQMKQSYTARRLGAC